MLAAPLWHHKTRRAGTSCPGRVSPRGWPCPAWSPRCRLGVVVTSGGTLSERPHRDARCIGDARDIVVSLLVFPSTKIVDCCVPREGEGILAFSGQALWGERFDVSRDLFLRGCQVRNNRRFLCLKGVNARQDYPRRPPSAPGSVFLRGTRKLHFEIRSRGVCRSRPLVPLTSES